MESLDAFILVATKVNTRLFIVGGYVRNMLLNVVDDTDIDLVIECDISNFVNEFTKLYPDTAVKINKQFLTATIILNEIKYDIASTRTETYNSKSRYPKVKLANSIEEDYIRRDFTINAIYYELYPNNGTLHDFADGMNDIKLRRLVPLHKNSFIDDPTRISRGNLLSKRYGLSINF